MSLVRWLLLLLIAGVINGVLFFAVPLLNVLMLDKPNRNRIHIENITEVVQDVRQKQNEQQKKEIRKLNQPSKAFKPTRTSAAPSKSFLLDLSLASGPSDGSVGAGAGGNGKFGSLGGGGPGAEVFDPSEVDQAAKVLREAEVNYPSRARREGVSGYVKFYLVIDARGQISDLQVLTVEPKGYGFEIEAEKALRQYRFEPAKIKDVPVAQKFTKEFVFDQGY